MNIYVGDAIKKGDTSFNPTEPPEVLMDPLEPEEQPEPTPLTEPVEVNEPGEGEEAPDDDN